MRSLDRSGAGKPRSSATRRAVRAARADALHAHLYRYGGDALEAISTDLVTNGNWTEAQLERAIDDLVDQGRAEVDGTRGYVDISPTFSVAEWARLEQRFGAVA